MMAAMKRWLLTCALAFPMTTLAHPAAEADDVSVVFVGDVMVAETPGKLIAQGVDPFLPFQSILQAHDLRIGNLECVVATGGRNAQSSPSRVCRYSPLMLRTTITQAISQEALKSRIMERSRATGVRTSAWGE